MGTSVKREKDNRFYIPILLLLFLLISISAYAISWTALPALDEGKYLSTATADFNNDGYKDIVGVSDSNIGAWQQSLRWVCPASFYSWSFNPVTDLGPAFTSASVKAVTTGDIGRGPANAPDLKADGYKDVIVATSGGIYVFYSNGMGTWNSTPPYAVSNVGYGKMSAIATNETALTDDWTVKTTTQRIIGDNLPEISGSGTLNAGGVTYLKKGVFKDGDTYKFTFSNSSSFEVTKSGIPQGPGKIGEKFTTTSGTLEVSASAWTGFFIADAFINLIIDITPAVFSVDGDSSGAYPNASEGATYSSGGLSFRIEEDGLDGIIFDVGDQFTFSTSAVSDNQITADSDVTSLELADVDKDGALEVVAGTTNGIRVYDYSGLWNTLDNTNVLPTTGKWKMVVRDINHDGNLDIVGASESGNVIKGWYGDGNGTWTESVFTSTSAVYYSIDVGDINRDGKYDIAAGRGNLGIEVWLQDSNGDFNAIDKPTGSDRYYDVKLVDIDKNGVLDLVGAQWGGGILVWLGDGTGDWIPETTPIVTGDYRDISIDDMNNDGLLDIIGADNSGGMHSFLQNREGTTDVGWAKSNFPTTSGDFQGTAAGDFNRDGNMDAVVAGNASGVRVFYGDGRRGVRSSLAVFKSYSGIGNGTLEVAGTDDVKTISEDWTVTAIAGGASPVFSITRSSVGTPETAQYSLPGTYTNASTGVSFVIYPGTTNFTAGDTFEFKTRAAGITDSGIYYGVATADFNNDGILDIAAASNGGEGIDIWYGDGEGAWSNETAINSGNYYYLTTGDIDHDGDYDLVAGSDSGVQVFLNAWDGTTTGWTHSDNNDPVTTGSYAGVALADFDNDGKLDVAAANRGGGGIKVWTGKGDGSFRRFYVSKPMRDDDLDGVEDSFDTLTNTGNGTISAVTLTDTASKLAEGTWSAVATGVNTFTVNLVDGATDTYDTTLGASYTNAPYGISFTITSGSTPFAAGDSFTFKTYKDTGPEFKSSVIFPDGRIMTFFYDGIAVADFDRDGNIDIVAGNLGNFGVQVFYGDGDKGLFGHITWTLSNATPPVKGCGNAGDVYVQDLAASPQWSDNGYRWQGSFGKDVYMSGEKLRAGVTTQDYTTGTEDVILTGHEPTEDEPWDFDVSGSTGAYIGGIPYRSSSFDFILRGSYYSFEPADYLYFSTYEPGTATDGQYYGVAAGDINKDGYPDIVAGNKSNGGVQVWLNGGYDRFYRKPLASESIEDVWASAESPVTSGNYNGVAVMDFNKDGKLDILAAHDFTNGTGADVWINTVDIVLPQVASVSPANGDTGVSTDSAIEATFSEEVDCLTIRNADTSGASAPSSESTLSVHGSKTGYHSGIKYCGLDPDKPMTVTFVPDTPFGSDEAVTVTLSSRITDLAGNYLDGNGDGESLGDPSDNYSWSFTVKDAVAPLPPTGLAGTPGEGKAVLTWTQPVKNENGTTLNDLAGFDVYRGTISGGPYFKINASIVPASTTTYTNSQLANGTTYYYVVTAVDEAGNKSINSNQASVTPALDTLKPNAPSSLAAVAGDGVVTLAWPEPTKNEDGSSLTDLAGYNVYRGIVSSGPYNGPINEEIIPEGTSTYEDKTVTNGTTYYYVVKAVDTSINANASDYSNEASALPVADTTAPKAPGSLAATGGDSIVTLTWSVPTANEDLTSPISDFGSYRIYRDTKAITTVAGLLPVAVITDASTTSWQDTVANGLVLETTYYYRVTSKDAKGNESTTPSNEASAVAFNPVALITLFAGEYAIPADGVTKTTIYAYVQTPLGYPVPDGTTLNFSISCVFTNCGALSSTTALTTGGIASVELTASTTYTSTLTITGATGVVSGSTTIAFSPGPPETLTLNASPSSLLASSSSTTTITAEVKDIAGNYVKDGLYVMFTTTLGTFANKTKTSDPVPPVGGKASVTMWGGTVVGTATVTAVIGSKSGSKNIEIATTLSQAPAAPAGLTAIVAGSTSVNLSWTANTESDLQGYKVYQGTASGSGYASVTALGKVTSYQVTGLTAGTTYYFVITAVNTSGYESSQSTEVSARPGLMGDVDGALVGGKLTVNFDDLAALAVSFGYSKTDTNCTALITTNCYNQYADLNGDATIDGKDLGILGRNFGRTN